jgi:hypothetical protein
MHLIPVASDGPHVGRDTAKVVERCTIARVAGHCSPSTLDEWHVRQESSVRRICWILPGSRSRLKREGKS